MAIADDDGYSSYQKTVSIWGNIRSVGSDTLASMMTLWSEEFSNLYPSVSIQVQASGSSTAIPALNQGTAQFGPMSRAMRGSEIASFEREHGYPPTELKIAIDAIGIFVHQDNTLPELDLSQLDAIFSSTLRCGSNQPIESWQELGVDSEWSARKIQLYGRNSASGTYGFFKKNALCKGDFKPQVNEQPGSASVVQSVATSINAIGYSGAGYKIAGTRLVPIVNEHGDTVLPTTESITQNRYPLSRYLYLYINKHPTKAMPELEREFIRFIFSKQGQAVVSRVGYIPVSPEVAFKEQQKLGISK